MLRILHVGVTGDDVIELQSILSILKYKPGMTDGIYGVKTAYAVIQFQKDNGFVSDGIVGPITWTYLQRLMATYFIYIIKPGDTFYKIALAHNLSLSELLTLNPEIKPNMLMIGQAIRLTAVNITDPSIRITYHKNGAYLPYILTSTTSSISKTFKNVKLNYPQINNLRDSSKKQKINELIKISVLEVLNGYKDSLSSLSLAMDYEIKYKGEDLLSIEYLGLANMNGAAHPVNVIKTTNIDLKKEKQLSISDVVTLNDSFVEKIRAGKYKAYSSNLDIKAAGALKDVLNSYSSQDLLKSFKQQTAEFYFTKDSLGVSIEVAHVVGDHLEMEIEYKALDGLLLVKPQ
ncbi:MAG: peptidoglycan-binding protein [Gammaproteobacteria bacterium]|nr:peptidoglycan-binding protein [Gammaproteobacteria bacterium]MDR3667756.1 peptidoglycan-binding protein [Ignavibacteriaceae bacterium]